MKLEILFEGTFLQKAADMAIALYRKGWKMPVAIQMASNQYKEDKSEIGRELARRREAKRRHPPKIEKQEKPKSGQLSLF